MNGAPPQPCDSRLDTLERALASLEARVAAMEDAQVLRGAPERMAARGAAPVAHASGHLSDIDAVALMTLVGRTLMVLGGAYLLRALTESGVWPAGIGVACGFAYAAAWLSACDHAARQDRWISATFHGASAVMIALPLSWESVTRFHLMDAAAASVTLTVITVATLAIATRRGLQTVAWIAVLGALAVSTALIAATGRLLPFTVADIALGIVALWISYTADWIWLRWPAAFTADVLVIALAIDATGRTASSAPAAVVAVQLLLLGAYVTSVAIRTLVRGREVIPFEALQSTAALLIGFGGAIGVAQTTGIGRGLLVSIGIACGIGCYAVAFAFVARRQGMRRNFYFYTSMALVLIVAGVALGLPYPAFCWAGLTVLAAAAASVTATRADDDVRAAAPAVVTLSVHAVTYLMAASVASGLLGAAVRALVGPPTAQPALSPPLAVVFAAGSACWVILAGADAAIRSQSARLPRALVAGLLASAGAAWLAAIGLSDVTTVGDAAAVRTVALAVTALSLAWLGRRPRLREATWLVYPTLAVGGVKLLAEDLPHSNAAALFVALAMYGGALIAAPRLARPRRSLG